MVKGLKIMCVCGGVVGRVSSSFSLAALPPWEGRGVWWLLFLQTSCCVPEKWEEKKAKSNFFSETLTQGPHLPVMSKGWRLVTWSYLAARESGKDPSLYPP